MKNTKGFVYKYRKKLGLTQRKMAESLFLSYNTYLAYEHGTRQTPVDVCINILKLSGEERDLKIIKCLEYVYYEKES